MVERKNLTEIFDKLLAIAKFVKILHHSNQCLCMIMCVCVCVYLHGGLVILSPSTDVLPEFLQKNNSLDAVVVTDTNSSHSCVAKAGWDARLQWRNINGDIISESNTNLSKSAYVTYSITNTSIMLTVNNSNYAVDDPIYRVYPVHNATLHYPAKNNTFFCVITGVNKDFLKQYNVSNLKYSLAVRVN